MANYTSCKIYIEQINGELDLDLIKNNIEILRKENNIGQNIKVYHTAEQSSFEMRFGSKWYASMIDEIFLPSQFEIWILGSDEGGASDYLKYYPSIQSQFSPFTEKALFKFDEIELRGDTNKIFENLKEIFGWGISNSRRWNRGDYVEIKLNGIYKSNNYFNHEYEQQLEFIPIGSIPIEDEFNQRTELWETIWDLDGILFRENFYQEVLNRPEGKTNFDYLNSIKFKYKGKITNTFEWNTSQTVSSWIHKAKNNYFNLVNTNYIMIKHERNTEGNNR